MKTRRCFVFGTFWERISPWVWDRLRFIYVRAPITVCRVVHLSTSARCLLEPKPAEIRRALAGTDRAVDKHETRRTAPVRCASSCGRGRVKGVLTSNRTSVNRKRLGWRDGSASRLSHVRRGTRARRSHNNITLRRRAGGGRRGVNILYNTTIIIIL